MKIFGVLVMILVSALLSSCEENTDEGGMDPTADEVLFGQVTQSDPFTSYTLFPDVDSIAMGTLNGSTAHRPLVRVSMNATAFTTLQNDTLPPGSSFPNGSVVFKEIISGGQTTLYAVMRKDSSNAFSGNGWLWAEYYPDGRVAISVEGRGNECITCHSLEEGIQNDLVRTFERQN